VLVFAAPECGPCAKIVPYLNRLGLERNDVLITALVTGPREVAARFESKFSPPYPCVADDGSGAFETFKVRVTPFAFVIGADGRVHSKGLCSSPAHLAALLTAGGLDAASSIVEEMAKSEAEMVPLQGKEMHR
jgi:thiol-disulfide isomerase/thioredoxin